MKHSFRKVAIVGMGLIGGSLALALRGKKLVDSIVGIDLDAVQLERAIARGAVDHTTEDLLSGVNGADLLVLAIPVGSMASIVRQLAAHLSPGCVITDVGSTKKHIVRVIETILSPSALFVGGHPIAGREQSGMQAASEDLFTGARCILTPTSRTDRQAVDKIQALWNEIGCDVVIMDPENHDRIFAVVSHLPHVVAYALVGTMIDYEEKGGEILSYSAGGFRDFARVAASSPQMWRDIFLENREHILQALQSYLQVLEQIREMIQNRDEKSLEQWLVRAKSVQERIVDGNSRHHQT